MNNLTTFFDYYLYQTGEILESMQFYLVINKMSGGQYQKSFNSDPYILALMSSDGKILDIDEELLQKKILS